MDFKEKIAQILAEKTGQEKAHIEPLIEVPPQGMGDYAYPTFMLAKEQKFQLISSKK